jgi:hypothetical protein
MPRTEIPKIEFLNYGPERLYGTPNDFAMARNIGPDAWHLPFTATIGTQSGGALRANLSIEQAREMRTWLGRALADADAETEAA